MRPPLTLAGVDAAVWRHCPRAARQRGRRRQVEAGRLGCHVQLLCRLHVGIHAPLDVPNLSGRGGQAKGSDELVLPPHRRGSWLDALQQAAKSANSTGQPTGTTGGPAQRRSVSAASAHLPDNHDTCSHGAHNRAYPGSSAVRLHRRGQRTWICGNGRWWKHPTAEEDTEQLHS